MKRTTYIMIGMLVTGVAIPNMESAMPDWALSSNSPESSTGILTFTDFMFDNDALNPRSNPYLCLFSSMSEIHHLDFPYLPTLQNHSY